MDRPQDRDQALCREGEAKVGYRSGTGRWGMSKSVWLEISQSVV